MVAAVVRNVPFMPPDRWMLPVKPLLLPRRLKQLRTARGWTQKQVEERLLAMGSPIGRQNSLSRYESGDRQPEPSIVDDLNMLYGLPDGELRTLWWRDQSSRREMEDIEIPTEAVAIPNEPELVQTVEALLALDDGDMESVRQFIRHVRDNPSANTEERVLSYARYVAERSRASREE